MSVFLWDGGKWDQAEWAGGPPPEPGWGDDWRWWYQIGTGSITDLNHLIVEARWTTDSHSLGDGTFRGDLQPGTLTLRMWDPEHLLDNLNKMGAIFAVYKPTQATWCWFYDSFSRGLFAPGDPAAADCVYTGTLWPTRFTSLTQDTAFPSQSVSARLAAVVTEMNNRPDLTLPALTSALAAQSQAVSAAAAASNGMFPSWLQFVRDAAPPGVAWLAAQPAVAGGATGAGRLVLNYARWETDTERTLDRSQIVTGPPVTASADWVITQVTWEATAGATGAQTTSIQIGPGIYGWGYQGPGVMRMWGSVDSISGPEAPGCASTGQNLTNDHADPSEQTLSSISLQSGTRFTPTGAISNASWDPYAHVFAPTDVAVIDDGTGKLKKYRVTKSDHRLTATIWQTTHYLEKFTAPHPLP